MKCQSDVQGFIRKNRDMFDEVNVLSVLLAVQKTNDEDHIVKHCGWS